MSEEFSHTVTLQGPLQTWPRLKSARSVVAPSGYATFDIEIDLLCPRCGASPKVTEFRDGAVHVTQMERHGRLACLLARLT